MGQRSDIVVGPTERWHLVYERAGKAITELLLLFFFVILLVVRPLRSFIESIDYGTVLLCQAQEDSVSLAAPMITPAISTVPKTLVAIPVLTHASTPAFEKKPFI
jgi:hypothetical protein